MKEDKGATGDDPHNTPDLGRAVGTPEPGRSYKEAILEGTSIESRNRNTVKLNLLKDKKKPDEKAEEDDE